MNYKDFNDYELLDNIYSFNEDASEILLYKYRPLIVSVAQKFMPYCDGGIDLNDLVQEGMLGLNDAINTFNENKEANFGTYARLCIERRVRSAVKSTKRYKQRALNESTTLVYDLDDVTVDKNLIDESKEPLAMIEAYEQEQNLIKKLNDQLSDVEKQVFDLKMNDFTYREIAEILEKDPKVIDNTIQRIRNKLKKIIEEEKRN